MAALRSISVVVSVSARSTALLMSVVRSTYRHVLRQCAKTSKRIPEVDDLCFCIFGIALRLDDLKAAGYGDTPKAIARSFFDRPSIPGVPRDTPAARLQAAFSVLRQLRATDKLDIEAIQIERTKTIAEIQGKAKADSENQVVEKEEDGESADAIRDEVHMTTVTIYLDVPGKKIRKFERRVVLPNEFDKFPNYAYLMPPEPFYPSHVKQEIPYPLMIDTVLCIAAGSRRRVRDLKLAQTPLPSKRSRAPRKAATQRQAASSTSFARPTPSSESELERSVGDITTRAIAQAEFMEVELRTQYVCCNP
ncbi:hypothetical protein STCU_05627 [Strigomonas culicis]|nr:hypothetical protein STCU_05627 [Strigomonas culicis]|eukprot:EPY27685.1 hypothetical protein STCU_05627 [Strigomonas culicis]